ncbi:uncharacterized protein LOC126909079 [Daktulosphaira vitifoliae]|uniref:uncharacterized protein LOC126909079 n=1 Tax=Daktulosphaira vitifoliae TaxID=58002 RepID=UPI0021AA5872|nr:uncharacterized protein LOC126909079 [Daktulosphaira vitifoliae]
MAHFGINDPVRAIKLDYTTCIILYDMNDCTGKDLIVRDDIYDLFDKQYNMGNMVSSIGPCTTLGRKIFGKFISLGNSTFINNDNIVGSSGENIVTSQMNISLEYIQSFGSIVNFLNSLNEKLTRIEAKINSNSNNYVSTTELANEITTTTPLSD